MNHKTKWETRISIWVLIILMALLSGCSQASHGEVVSKAQRNLQPDISESDYQSFIRNNTKLAFDVYHELAANDEDGNIFFSPFSVSQALAMTWEGARTETEQQMAEILHFLQPREKTHKAFNKTNLILESQDGVTLDLANSVWVQKSEKWNMEFLDTLKSEYGSGVHAEDLTGKSEATRAKINDWVAENTNDKIKDLLPPGSLHPLSPMVLVNAIWFYGGWKYVFDEERTHTGRFYLLDESYVEIDMMSNSVRTNYYNSYWVEDEDDKYMALELQYEDSDMSILFIVPRRGTFKDIESKLDNEFIDHVSDSFVNGNIQIYVPKMEMRYKSKLSSTFESMGMNIPFSAGADFSGMNGKRDLWIDEIYHQAYFKMDESGTSAAAATAVAMARGGNPPPICLCNPFFFVIRDNQSGVILFMGRVMNPLESN